MVMTFERGTTLVLQWPLSQETFRGELALPPWALFTDGWIEAYNGHRMQYIVYLKCQIPWEKKIHGAYVAEKLNQVGNIMQKIIFLGFTISRNGVAPDDCLVGKVRKTHPPESVKEVEQFCGLVNFCGRLIPISLWKVPQDLIWGKSRSRSSSGMKHVTEHSEDWSLS